MLCPKCNNTMNNVMHFDKERNYQFYRCSNCQEKTKKKRIHFDDVLKEEINKQKNDKN